MGKSLHAGSKISTLSSVEFLARFSCVILLGMSYEKDASDGNAYRVSNLISVQVPPTKSDVIRASCPIKLRACTLCTVEKNSSHKPTTYSSILLYGDCEVKNSTTGQITHQ